MSRLQKPYKLCILNSILRRQIIRYLLLMILSEILLSSCDNEKDIVSLTYNLNPFHSVILDSPFDVTLNESDTFNISIFGDKFLAEKVKYEIKDSVLYIWIDSHLVFSRPKTNVLDIYINSKPLFLVKTEETCNLKTDSPITSEKFNLNLMNKVNEAKLELNCKNFYYYNNFVSGGKLILWGNVENIHLTNLALMQVDALNLDSRSAYVINGSKGDCTVNVEDKLTYSITGIGNINLYGSPKEIIMLEESSSGKLIVH